MKTNNALVAVIALLILLVLVIVTSCGKLPNVPEIKTSVGNVNIKAYDFSYKGHDYIYFKSGSGKLGTAGVVHSPNCICKR
jgi:hypothetical protein